MADASNTLVSYPAPADSGVTFYISGYTGSATIGTAGLFAGTETTQDDVSYPYIIDICGHEAATALSGTSWNTADVAKYFLFATSSENTGEPLDNSTLTDITGLSDTSLTIAFPSITAAATTDTLYSTTLPNTTALSAIKEDRLAVQRDYVDTLSAHVFGHRGAADLFSNQESVKDAWDTAEAAAIASANASITASTGETQVAAQAAASKELIENMMASSDPVRKRFTLGYGAAITTAGDLAAGTTLACTTSSDAANGTGAKVTVVMTDASTIHTIVIANDPTDGSSTGTHIGAGYAKGDDLVITVGTGVITIAKLNSVQVAILNGTLNSTTIATEAPLEADDKIRVKMSVSSATGQLNVRGSAVSFTQSYYIDYRMIGGNHTA
jgi:hypothetical protein